MNKNREVVIAFKITNKNIILEHSDILTNIYTLIFDPCERKIWLLQKMGLSTFFLRNIENTVNRNPRLIGTNFIGPEEFRLTRFYCICILRPTHTIIIFTIWNLIDELYNNCISNEDNLIIPSLFE